MAINLLASRSDPPLAALVVANMVRSSVCVSVKWGTRNALELPGTTIDSPLSICRYLARTLQNDSFYGSDPLQRTEIDHWLNFSTGPLSSKGEFSSAVEYLNQVLGPATYLVGNQLTLADIYVWGTLYKSSNWIHLPQTSKPPVNTTRWYNFINSLEVVTALMSSVPDVIPTAISAPSVTEKSNLKDGSKPKDEGKFVELPGAERGKVVVRFPPEASGYLHIGHAKAALLNQYYKDAYEGKLIMRFDDTNPAKEKVDFEQVILEDLKLLQLTPDTFTHTSNYFELMLEFCEKLLHQGLAYVDDTDAETMKQEREQRIESKNRNNSIEKNLKMWTEMKSGSESGQKCCVRAKIDMNSANGCMRDPTIYRCKNEPHPRTGTKYKVYPTYDFACPIVDSIEGVTHCLRTMEYHDRDEQFFWFIDALGLRKPHIWEYSRLNMMNTVLSKRKLTWFVDENLVDGWDDPRFPTVRGVLRRGMTVEGLKQFIVAQGSSRSVVLMEWDKIWAFNKKVIDPVAPRYTSLSTDNVPVLVKNVTAQPMNVPKHPKTSSVGEKTIWIGPRVLIDREDAETLKEGENATFINWGNLLVEKINRKNGKILSIEASPNIENQDYKKTVKLTWLAETDGAPFVPCVCVYFDHIISKSVLGKDEDFKAYVNRNTRKEVFMLGDPELLKIKKSDIIQLQRRGFFICDTEYAPPSLHSGRETPVVLFYIPDGRAKELATSGAPKDTVAPSTTPAKTPAKAAAALPSVPAASSTQLPQTAVSSGDAADLNQKIQAQGELVRKLKSEKAAKDVIDAEVKILLKLKADFKAATGLDWKPGIKVSAAGDAKQSSNLVESLNKKIVEQGDKVRITKAQKASKDVIDAEVKILLNLKAEFKQASGQDWKPPNSDKATSRSSPPKAQSVPKMASGKGLIGEIISQISKIEELKSKKTSENVLNAESKSLLNLKTEFTNITGQEWNSNTDPAQAFSAVVGAQGDNVRQLKSAGSDAALVDEQVKKLLKLKADYKTLTGEDYAPVGSNTTRSKTEKKKTPAPKAKEKPASQQQAPAKKIDEKKQTRLGLEATKEDNLPEWYSQVITKGELIEYYDVSGCYIYRPWSFAIWESIKEFFDGEIKKLGVQNCYFPLFVSRSVLETEKTHVADFFPEVAWVTKSGDTDLAEPIAIRPTSETVMYPAYAKWVQSYRDLPIKLNQWNNIVRWEFKHPQPFLRTREFLWQEGHTAYASADEAEKEVTTILDLYGQVYTDLLAIPVIKGRKTKKEQFAGGDYTTTVEAFISASGRAIQGATSHHLGQNFSKMFDISYEDPETKEKKFVYQNSWGITTRTIGVMIMVHADNRGLVLPPKVACIQVVIVPCGITVSSTDEERAALQSACTDLENEIKASGFRVYGDYRDNYSPGWRYNHWELKGVPIRVEYGPKDLAKQQIVAVRRDTGEKITYSRKSAVKDLSNLLILIQNSLLERAQKDLSSHTIMSSKWDEFCLKLDEKNIILSPFCGEINCEEQIKKESARNDEAEPGAPSMGAKGLCIPFEQPAAISSSDKCINPSCKNKPQFYTLFGRSY